MLRKLYNIKFLIIPVFFFSFFFFINNVKALEPSFTTNDVWAYYPLTEDCDDYFDNYNLTLRNGASGYESKYLNSFFSSAFAVYGEGSSSTTRTSACYNNNVTFDMSEDKKISFSLWIEPGIAPSADGVIVSFINSVGNDWIDIMINKGKIKFRTYFGYWHTYTWDTNLSFETGTEYMISFSMIVKAGEATIDLWVNDEKETSNLTKVASLYYGVQASQSYDFTIGGQSNGFTNGYNGLVGQVLILDNHYFTQNDIDALYENPYSYYIGSGGSGGSIPPPPVVGDVNYVMPVWTKYSLNYGVPYDIEYVYNVCGYLEDEELSNSGLFAELRFTEDDSIIKSMPLFSCSGNTNINIIPNWVGSKQVYLNIAIPETEHLAIRQSEDFLLNSNLIQYSDEWYLRTPDYIYSFFYDTGLETVKIPVVYDLCSEEVLDFDTYSYNIYLKHRNVGNTKTPYSSVNLTSCSGVLEIDFDVPASYIADEFTLSIYDDADNEVFTGIDSFMVIFDSYTEVVAGYQDFYSGGDFSVPFLSSITNLNILGFRPFGWLDYVFKQGYNAIRYLFPFGSVLVIGEAWTASADFSIADFETFDFIYNVINVNDNNSVFLSIPEAWAGNSTASILIYSDDFLNEETGSSAFFSFIREMTKYAMIMLFLILLYRVSSGVSNKLTNT